ncbi:MAG: acyl-CoA dehydrogenase family protein [Acidimicrobiia bacterium]|nr:acyl-CoA dehydrogenase family protein [Acidimicrobiia bacterium]
MTATTVRASAGEVRTELEAWLDENWDPSLTAGEWWRLLSEAGWADPSLPENAGGRDFGRDQVQAWSVTLAERGVLGPPSGLGRMLAAPTIATHGTQEQIDRYLPSILDGRHAWCQLFSEPGAGSDLAGLQCRAERDGDEWVVTGQKVWTSGGQIAQYGMLIARTDPDAPKHQGISYFAIDMDQPGIDIRPLREMTGRALFNEVFLDEARVADADLIGGLGNGWRVANTTLAFERAGLGSAGRSPASATPGPIAGALGRTVTDFLGKPSEGGVPRLGSDMWQWFVELARKQGRGDDVVLRDRLAGLYTLIEVNRLSGLRAKAGGSRTGAEGNLGKLAMSELFRQFREIGLDILGAGGMLAGRDAESNGAIQELALFSPGPAIYGGTDQVQRNIIGERVLGLPKEPGPAKDTPFSELPKN